MTILQQLKQLVKNFEENIDELKDSSYKEARVRQDYIDPLFSLLGWDISNTQGFGQEYREVVSEDSLQIEGQQKAPDYSFRIWGVRKFFVEAKKPAVKIKENKESSFQLRRYGYTAKLSVSILTDFEEFSVYDTRIKPKKDDDAKIGRIFYCKFSDYENEWEFLQNSFSKDAILKGKFDKYTRKKTKLKTEPIDKAFLKDIENWREVIAKNLAINNQKLDLNQLNLAVQKIIDRFLFLRIAEDKKIEPFEQIQKISFQKNIYPAFVKLCSKADKKYNSGLFHKEKWIDELVIDDKVLKPIIKFLYDCPYAFNVLAVEILGHIYEQFLGKTIRLTAGHQAKVEEKPEVRKAGGVYYTPEYIVRYIVENTIGEKLKKAKLDDKTNLTNLAICDPACGSGSFLIGAYGYLLQWYKETFLKNLKKYVNNGTLIDLEDNKYQLSISKKREILLHHIFGVDIDMQAVEVAKLSLLLKMMEDESEETSRKIFPDEGIFPNLESNIKCGNSLIGSDFYEQNEMSLFPVEEITKVNIFDWEKSFPEIFEKGGFDCVIGNPPYGADLEVEEIKDFVKDKSEFKSIETVILFLEKSKSLIKKIGKLSFIIPKSFCYASNYKNIRDAFSEEFIELVDCGKVWKEVKLEQVVVFFEKEKKSKSYITKIRVDEEIESYGNIKKSDTKKFGFFLNAVNEKEIELAENIIKNSNNKFLTPDFGENQRGAILQKFLSDNGDCEVIGGVEIDDFGFKGVKGRISAEKITDDKARIKKNAILVQNIIAHIENPIDHIKITPCIPSDSAKIIVDTINQITLTDEVSSQFLWAILRSKLINWFVYRFVFGKAIRTMHFDNPTTSRIPIPQATKPQQQAIEKLVDERMKIAKSLQEASESHKNQYEKIAESLDKQIDDLVFDLYGLTKEEREIVLSS